MNGSLVVAFAVTEFILCASPGPAVMLSMSKAIRFGVIASIGVALGVVAANAIYFSVSATSVGTLLVNSEILFLSLKYIGSLYLIYLGCVGIKQSRESLNEAFSIKESDRRKNEAVFDPLFSGFLSQLSNPKGIIFFVVILPQFVDRSENVAEQLIILAFVSISIEFLVLVTYGISVVWLVNNWSNRNKNLFNILGNFLLIIIALILMLF